MGNDSIKFTTDTIRSMNLFEEVTGVEVKDAITKGNKAYFVVEEGKAGLAIGKGGETIKKVQNNLDKDVKVYEFSDSLQEFVKNIVPVKVNGVKMDRGEESTEVRIDVDRGKWSRVVGKDGRNIEVIERFLKREFGVDNVELE
ncbi:MAG: NusA-like transcription termination signal-binding factor [Candidatus Nanohaloarchaeota archaeon QJJ-9]|nr:NusA-like transcription termination signal-binding factor [Candidatus Nanohaloarchaeota archaeon QJJ-9]